MFVGAKVVLCHDKHVDYTPPDPGGVSRGKWVPTIRPRGSVQRLVGVYYQTQGECPGKWVPTIRPRGSVQRLVCVYYHTQGECPKELVGV